ncbi:MAG: AsmA family protein [Puniceicoccales bacterium]|jgi:uncharacterized protein involved in outer membrane biogenesis|nr:AsmA family protein [Puniceicoccales bacterium]
MIKFLAKLVLCPIKWVANFVLKLAIVVTILLCLILLAGNFWIPTVVETTLTKMSEFKTSVGNSSGSIFRGRLDLKDFKIKNPNFLFQAEDFVSINNIVIDIDVMSLWKDTIVIEEVILNIDDLSMVTNGNGEDNYTLFVKNLKQAVKVPKEAADKTANTQKHGRKKSILIKNLTLSISTVHAIDERKNSSREYKIDYCNEFHDITDFSKLGLQLVGDLGKFGISIMIDSIISSIPMVPSIATDGIIKIKDVSLDAASKTKDLAEKVGSGIGNQIKLLLKKGK